MQQGVTEDAKSDESFICGVVEGTREKLSFMTVFLTCFSNRVLWASMDT